MIDFDRALEATYLREKVFAKIQEYVPLDCILDDMSDPVNVGKEEIIRKVDALIYRELREICLRSVK